MSQVRSQSNKFRFPTAAVVAIAGLLTAIIVYFDHLSETRRSKCQEQRRVLREYSEKLNGLSNDLIPAMDRAQHRIKRLDGRMAGWQSGMSEPDHGDTIFETRSIYSECAAISERHYNLIGEINSGRVAIASIFQVSPPLLEYPSQAASAGDQAVQGTMDSFRVRLRSLSNELEKLRRETADIVNQERNMLATRTEQIQRDCK